MRHLRPLSCLMFVLACSTDSGRAFAGPPSPANSTCPTRIALVGRSASGADSALGGFEVVVRGFSNNPEAFSPVWVDLSHCPDCRLDPETAPGAALAAHCPYQSAGYACDAQGRVHLTIVGASSGHAGTPGTSMAWIYAEGVLLRQVPVAIYDLDGTGGVGAGDLSLWLSDFGTSQYIGRDDYDGDSVVGANDLSLWLTAYGAAGSAQSATVTCP